MPDRYSEWDAYRLKRRSEPTPPEGSDAPPPETYSPAVVWATAMYAEDVRPGDLVVRQPSPAAPHEREGSATSFPRSAGSKLRPILLGVASLAVLATLIAAPVVTHLTGWTGHEPSKAAPPAGATTPALSPVSPGTAGPGCGGDSYQRVGYYVDGKAGWLGGSGGSGAGCGGRFDALPMSGDAKKADPTLYARWTFDPRAKHQCKVALFIPNNSDKTYVGGNPAHYTVLQKKGGAKLLSFSIDQPRSLGRWVGSTAFTVDGPFEIRLANTGKDWTDTSKTFAHVVAAQARAVCS